MPEIKLYLVRLKKTSIGEMVYRIRELLLIWLLNITPSNLVQSTIRPRRYPHDFNLSLPGLTCRLSQIQIGELLSNDAPKVNDRPARITKGLSQKYFASISWRRERFDIRSLWEPARLQTLTTLLIYEKNHPGNAFSGPLKRICLENVDSWIRHNPFLRGPHYISVMECGLRIPVFFYALKILDNLNRVHIKRILNAIYQHAWWIEKRLSLFSSLGNHTIAESVGLIFGGAIFSSLTEGRRWLQKGIQILHQELPHQVLADGGPVEQAFGYHRFVLDLYWLAIDFLERNHLHHCRQLKSRLKQGEIFLATVQDRNGNLPPIGDSDDGFAIAPGITPPKPNVKSPQKRIHIFHDAGYAVINTSKNGRLLFDHGPLGMPPLCNHGHADALSVTLEKEGKYFLVDPGTYRYNGMPAWRRYFKGTRAHNTVTIDGRDQSVQETGFVWSQPYQAKLIGFSKDGRHILIKAVHDGYERLSEPVQHHRRILFTDDGWGIIKDSFTGRGVHEFELNFHLHPDVDPVKKGSWWQLNNNGVCIYLRLQANEDFKIVNGSQNPIHGWYSAAYGEKQTCNVLSCRKTGRTPQITFTTAVCMGTLTHTGGSMEKPTEIDGPA